MDQHQRGLLHLRDHIGHGKGLAGPGDTEQRLVFLAGRNPGDQLLDGLTLISAGLEWGFELKRRHGRPFGRYLTIGNSIAHNRRGPKTEGKAKC
jgi:hypothetical protein